MKRDKDMTLHAKCYKLMTTQIDLISYELHTIKSMFACAVSLNAFLLKKHFHPLSYQPFCRKCSILFATYISHVTHFAIMSHGVNCSIGKPSVNIS